MPVALHVLSTSYRWRLCRLFGEEEGKTLLLGKIRERKKRGTYPEAVYAYGNNSSKSGAKHVFLEPSVWSLHGALESPHLGYTPLLSACPYTLLCGCASFVLKTTR